MTVPGAWHQCERLDDQTFVLREPGHWEEPNLVLFIGSERTALVDTGLGIAPLQPVVRHLTDRAIVVLTTHVHWDHIGGHLEFPTVGVHPDDAGWLEHGLPLTEGQVRAQLMRDAFQGPPPDTFDPDRYAVCRRAPSFLLNDGDVVDLGDRQLEILHTPGHSPGHVCIFESETGILCTGDLLYRGTVCANYPSTDPSSVRDSYARLAALSGVRRIVPGHYDPDVPVPWIEAGLRTLDQLAEQDLLHHGTGLHHVPNCDLQFVF